MATKAAPKVSARRAEIRKDRHERREEIIDRWSARFARRKFAEEYSGVLTVQESIHSILWYGKWADRQDLIAEMDLSPQGLTILMAFLFRIIELKEMPYDEYLQTLEWKTRAAQAKKRYGGCCALDESHLAEHAHHRTYERRGRELPNDLVPLCATCHAKFHDKRPTR